MRKYAIVLWLLFTTCQAFAQNTLTGHVLGENHAVLPYASVKLLSNDSVFIKGTLTDADGKFVLSNLSAPRYILCISSLGYKTIYTSVVVTNQEHILPAIQMEADHYALNEIIVKGNTVMKKDGHLLIIPDKLQKEHSYTGYDLVYNMMLPGVNVDRRTGKISTIAGNVSMYINGVKVERKDIENLRGNDVLKVEYYDIPTGRYAGESAVINYITKVYETGGVCVFVG